MGLPLFSLSNSSTVDESWVLPPYVRTASSARGVIQYQNGSGEKVLTEPLEILVSEDNGSEKKGLTSMNDALYAFSPYTKRQK